MTKPGSGRERHTGTTPLVSADCGRFRRSPITVHVAAFRASLCFAHGHPRGRVVFIRLDRAFSVAGCHVQKLWALQRSQYKSTSSCIAVKFSIRQVAARSAACPVSTVKSQAYREMRIKLMLYSMTASSRWPADWFNLCVHTQHDS
jgi:hypothetical protein